MRYAGLIFLLVLFSCRHGVEEKLVTDQLNQNSESLQKQLNLVEKTTIRIQSEMDTANPVYRLLQVREHLITRMEDELKDARSFETAKEIIDRTISDFNSSLAIYSSLQLEWKSESPESYKHDLMESWKRNNSLLVQLAMLEKSLEFFESHSRSASERIRPVIYTDQYSQVRKGNNVIFNIAFKSNKPELVQIHIKKATLNGKTLDTKEIDVDPYTQRFILHNLKKGKYSLEGYLEMINNRGIRETYPFNESFTVD